MSNWQVPKVYAAKHKSMNIVSESRSGGVFTALSDEIFRQEGVVYGCILTDSFEAVHVRAENVEIRDKMRGSKYIQSKMQNSFVNVKADLDAGRKVLFSGTSCQVAGLRHFLGKDYPNLFCIDIVCHGVPSLTVWRQYIKWIEEKYSSKVLFVEFRNKKKFGWKDHVESLKMSNGKTVHRRIFARMFYGHNIIRPCCYKCNYKSTIHPGDITIADYWGIEKAAPEFNDNKGVSLVLINNDKGEVFFESIKKNIVWKATELKDSMQPPLIKPFNEPLERKQFWDDFYSISFEKISKKYGGAGIINKIKDMLSIIKHKILK